MMATLMLLVCVVGTDKCHPIRVTSPVPFNQCVDQGREIGLSWLAAATSLEVEFYSIRDWGCTPRAPELGV